MERNTMVDANGEWNEGYEIEGDGNGNYGYVWNDIPC